MSALRSLSAWDLWACACCPLLPLWERQSVPQPQAESPEHRTLPCARPLTPGCRSAVSLSLSTPAFPSLRGCLLASTGAGALSPSVPAHSSPPLLRRTASCLPLSIMSPIHPGLHPLSCPDLVTPPAASMATLMSRTQSHVTQEQHLAMIMPTFWKFCSLTSETHLPSSFVLAERSSPNSHPLSASERSLIWEQGLCRCD